MDAVWLSPIFQSPMVDFGYDTSDYLAINEEYGTMEDFRELTAKCKELGIHLILDCVPNHTSDMHEWFKKSVSREPGYENFYVWHDGIITENGTRAPPNNWLSQFRYSAWEWNDERQQYYLHQFDIQQPDLNYRDPNVVAAMKDILDFWLDQGITGFRIDAVPDEPLSHACDDPEGWCYLDHIYTHSQNETYDMVFQWREVLDEYTRTHGGDTRIMMTEACASLENTIRFYGDENRNGSQIPFNFELLTKLNGNSSADDFKTVIESWLHLVPQGRVSNWVMGNHDNRRIASRYGVERADLLNIFLQTLPGVAVTYNGEEIALTDVYLSWEETLDPQACNTNPKIFDAYSRDPARTPFQWDNSTSAGFSTSPNTWLPVASDYRTNNVAAQENAPNSHLKIFEKVVHLRQENALKYGNLDMELVNEDILAFTRTSGNEKFVIVLNFSKKNYTINLNNTFADITGPLTVVVSSLQSNLAEEQEVSPYNLMIESNVGVVFRA